ncbi:gliding motility lipoprotein GldH [Bacteroidales bacterium OttesenSCG-928-M06]|nr:gliding motility lipoprotein GldH [Bacteroidales bacterium OttesenSCG-928-M06]
MITIRNLDHSLSFHLLFKGIVCLILSVLVSCTEKDFFSEYHSISNAKWNQEDTLGFTFQVYDTLSYYDVFLELRHNNNYPFQNIWLFIDYQTPSGLVRSDTLNAELADVYGKWYGKGIGLHSYSFPYAFHIQYKDTGTYIYNIRQGMRENPLNGINDVGLRISKKANQ